MRRLAASVLVAALAFGGVTLRVRRLVGGRDGWVDRRIDLLADTRASVAVGLACP